jgi:hypothetical protein
VAEQYGDGGVIGLHGTNQSELLGQDIPQRKGGVAAFQRRVRETVDS